MVRRRACALIFKVVRIHIHTTGRCPIIPLQAFRLPHTQTTLDLDTNTDQTRCTIGHQDVEPTMYFQHRPCLSHPSKWAPLCNIMMR